MDIPHFMYPFIADGHLSSSSFGALMNNDGLNIVHGFLCRHMFAFSWADLGAELPSLGFNTQLKVYRRVSP